MLNNRLLSLATICGLVCSLVLVVLAGPDTTAASKDASAGPARQVRAVAAPASRPATTPATPATPAEPRGLTAEQQAEVLAFAKARSASYYRKLKDLKRQDPVRYVNVMGRMYSVMKRWQRMPKAIQDAMTKERNTQIRIMAIVRQIRQAQTAAQKDRLKPALRQAVADHFEAAQDLRERRLQYLARQIKELQAALTAQRRQKQDIIARQVARWLKATKPAMAATRPSEK